VTDDQPAREIIPTTIQARRRDGETAHFESPIVIDHLGLLPEEFIFLLAFVHVKR